MEIVIATSNEGKRREIEAVLGAPGRHFITQSSLAIISPEETGASFVENALLKARHASKQSGQPALADDSGLIVPALRGAPGLYSARYAGPDATDADNNDKLLTALDPFSEEARAAFYFCALVFLRHPEDEIPLICQARWDGVIAKQLQGRAGFGYDPLFWVPTHHCTAAELAPEEKNQLSHRGQALRQLSDLLLFEGI